MDGWAVELCPKVLGVLDVVLGRGGGRGGGMDVLDHCIYIFIFIYHYI